ECVVGKTSQVVQELELVVDTAVLAIRVVEILVTVDERPRRLPGDRLEESVLLELGDCVLQADLQRRSRIAIVVVMQLHLAETVAHQAAEGRQNVRINLLAGIEERMLRRTSRT